MLQTVIEQIKQAQEPLTIYLDDRNLDYDDIQLIAEALKEAQAPITLHLSRNTLGASDISVMSIAEAIKEAQVPIVLYLNNNNLGDSGAGLIADAIENARFALFLDLSSNNIGSAGAELIAGAIMRAKVPLILDLGNNNLRDEGIRSIADAIRQTKVRLALYLHNNGVGNDGAGFIATAIENAAPSLFLDLGLNMIGDEGAQSLADALVKVQFSVTLDLYWNNIGIHGVRLLAYALKHAKTPINLNINCCAGSDAARVMNEALSDNFVVDSRLDPPRFLDRLGFSLCKKLLELQFNCPFMAALIQEYIGPSDLAWTEVTAIKKIEGASYENKYSSINRALLDAVYFNEPLEDQQPPELVEASLPLGQLPAELFDARQVLPLCPRRKRRKQLSDYKWVTLKKYRAIEDDDKENQCPNLDSAEDDGSSSLSSSSSPGGGASDSAEPLDKVIALLDKAQPNSEYKIASQRVDYTGVIAVSDTETLLKTLLPWLKALLYEQQQKQFSLFGKLLELLEQTIHPHKVVDDQLSDKPVVEVFEKEYSDLYGLISTNETDHAKANQDYSMPISIEPSGEILGKGLVINPLFVEGSVSL